MATTALPADLPQPLPRVGVDVTEPEYERFGCAVCGRTKTVVMGGRGPVKVDLERRQIGHFAFCVECLATSEETDERRVDVEMHILTMTAGPFMGQRWITNVDLV